MATFVSQVSFVFSKMRSLAPGANARILARAAIAASRLAEDVYLHATEEGLSLRAANASESAYWAVNFKPSFFLRYDIPEEEQSRRLSARSLAAAFRGCALNDVESCEITTDDDDDVSVRFRRRHGVLRVHRLAALDRNRMEAVHDAADSPNSLTAHRRLFTDAVDNFPTTEDRMTIETDDAAVTLSNGRPEAKDATRSSLKLNRSEFDTFNVSDRVRVTFPLREFRVLLMFADVVDRPVAVRFSCGGEPASFTVADGDIFEATLVTATERSDMPPTYTVFRRCFDKDAGKSRTTASEVFAEDSDCE